MEKLVCEQEALVNLLISAISETPKIDASFVCHGEWHVSMRTDLDTLRSKFSAIIKQHILDQ